MSQRLDDDLRAELAEVRRRLAVLEANDRAARDGPPRGGRRAFASKFLPRAVPAALLMGVGTLLYAASTGNALLIEPNGDVRIEAQLDVKGDVKVGKNVHANTFEGQTASVSSLTINKVDVAGEINTLKTNKAEKADVANQIQKLNTDKAEKGGSINQPFKASEIEARYKPNYDSGWVKDNNKTDHRTVFRHNLNYLPALVTVYFSDEPAKGKAYPVMFHWQEITSGNPVTVEVTSSEVVLNVYHGQHLRGIWDAQSARWTYYTEGYWRVFAFGGGP